MSKKNKRKFAQKKNGKTSMTSYGVTRRVSEEIIKKELDGIFSKHFPNATRFSPTNVNTENGVYNVDLFFETNGKVESGIRIVLIRNHAVEIRWIHTQPIDLTGQNRNVRFRAAWYGDAHIDVAKKLADAIKFKNLPADALAELRTLLDTANVKDEPTNDGTN